MVNPEPQQETTTSPPEDPLDPMIPGYLVVPAAQADEAGAGLNELGLGAERLEGGELAEHAYGDRTPDEPDQNALDSVAERIGYFRLADGTAEGTLTAIAQLREEGFDARPYFYCWPLNHWDLQSGEGYRDIQDADEELKALGNRTRGDADPDPWPVYVVDSGYDSKNPWAKGVLRNAELVGPQGGDAAHGTFVTALIGAMAPEARILIFATDLSHAAPTELAGMNATNELAVGVQIQKASHAHGTGPGILNLSLGTYETHIHVSGAAQQLGPLTLDTVIAEANGELTIVGAGGNELPHVWNGGIAYPASHRRVFGIGAGDADGDRPLVWHVWIGSGRRTVHQDVTHPGLKALAPGLDLQSPVGAGYACWSGSSFATALYSGYLAANAGSAPAQSKAPYPPALFCS